MDSKEPVNQSNVFWDFIDYNWQALTEGKKSQKDDTDYTTMRVVGLMGLIPSVIAYPLGYLVKFASSFSKSSNDNTNKITAISYKHLLDEGASKPFPSVNSKTDKPDLLTHSPYFYELKAALISGRSLVIFNLLNNKRDELEKLKDPEKEELKKINLDETTKRTLELYFKDSEPLPLKKTPNQ